MGGRGITDRDLDRQTNIGSVSFVRGPGGDILKEVVESHLLFRWRL